MRPNQRRPNVELVVEDPAGLPDVYASQCLGHRNEWACPSGHAFIFDRQSPCRPGDLVIIWKRLEALQFGEEQALIRRLVLAIPAWIKFPFVPGGQEDHAPAIVVESGNPRRFYDVPCAAVAEIHRCLGTFEEMGGEVTIPADLIERARSGKPIGG